jgi:hypothetical protein
MQELIYLVKKNEPCKGWAHSSGHYENGVLIVHYTDGMTLEQYQKDRGVELDALTWDEFSKRVAAYEQSLKTKPKQITKERYWEMLEVLPPCRWTNGRFHVSERLTGNLVSWFAQKGDLYFEFTEDAAISAASLDALISAAIPDDDTAEQPPGEYVGN